MKNKKKFLVLAAALIVAGIIGFVVSSNDSRAFSTSLSKRNLHTRLQSYRITMNYTDVIAGRDILGDGSQMRVKLFTLDPADHVLSFVSNIVTPFAMSNGSIVNIDSILPEQNGEFISSYNVAAPPYLDYAHLENGVGSGGMYPFYDENNPTDIVAVVGNNIGTSFADYLTQGRVDFYVTVVE